MPVSSRTTLRVGSDSCVTQLDGNKVVLLMDASPPVVMYREPSAKHEMVMVFDDDAHARKVFAAITERKK